MAEKTEEAAPKVPQRGMSDNALRFQRIFLLLLVVGISIVFIMVVRVFLVAVLLAAIFAGMSYPLYTWLRDFFGGRSAMASIFTILILLLGIGLPLAGLLALVASEAVQLSESVSDWFGAGNTRVEQLRDAIARLPFIGQYIPPTADVLAQLSALAGRAGPLFMSTVAAVGKGTAAFFLQAFVCLYAIFYFLVGGKGILSTILYYVPLHPDAEEKLLERFVSVARATLKGSLLIGLIQGAIAGVAFLVAGVPGAVFWGAIMVVLSVLPAIGSGLVWVPVVLYLFFQGESTTALLLGLWCLIVVGSIDNFLRPVLIGRDAKMADLLILVSTLGGISLFGALGFIIGPVVAALFVTVWHIYGETFQKWLPEVPDDFFSDVAMEPVPGYLAAAAKEEVVVLAPDNPMKVEAAPVDEAPQEVEGTQKAEGVPIVDGTVKVEGTPEGEAVEQTQPLPERRDGSNPADNA